MVEVGGGDSSALQRKRAHSSIQMQVADGRARIQYRRGVNWCLTTRERKYTVSYQGGVSGDIFLGLSRSVSVEGNMAPLNV